MKFGNRLVSRLALSACVTGIILVCSSCGVLVGNIKPVDEKSTQYGVMDLSQANPDWTKLEQEKIAAQNQAKAEELSSTEVPDVAYQSKSTASIISLDSACRHAYQPAEENLQTLTDLLFLGMTDVTLRTEKKLTVQRTPALETTIQGKLNGEEMKFRTVVLKRQSCVYDLVYMARPQFFDRHANDFDHFVASLRLK